MPEEYIRERKKSPHKLEFKTQVMAIYNELPWTELQSFDKSINKIRELIPGPPEKDARADAKLPMKHKSVGLRYVYNIRCLDIERASEI